MTQVGQAQLEPGHRIYAIGDVHGCLEALLALKALIERDLTDYPIPSHQIILLGDYIDRGPQSNEVIDVLSEWARRPEVIALRGNHDDGLMAFLEDPIGAAPFWLTYGGQDTLMSYGLAPVDMPAGEDELHAARDAANAAIPNAHKEFFERTRLFYRTGDYLFVHAGINPNLPLQEQTAKDLMWIREPFLSHTGDFGVVVVHGHTPVGEPDVRLNRINVDTGAVFGGALTALVLQDDQYRFLQVAA